MSLLRRSQASCLLRASRENPALFEDFYAAYAERVLVYFTRRVLNVDLALDLTSETFAEALDQRLQFRGNSPAKEQGWLFAIARRQLLHYYRDGSIERRALERHGLEPIGLDDQEIERFEQAAGLQNHLDAIHGAMAELPADQRSAVRLRVVEELEYAEVARRMGISEATARARVSRGLRALAAAVPEGRGGGLA